MWLLGLSGVLLEIKTYLRPYSFHPAFNITLIFNKFSKHIATTDPLYQCRLVCIVHVPRFLFLRRECWAQFCFQMPKLFASWWNCTKLYLKEIRNCIIYPLKYSLWDLKEERKWSWWRRWGSLSREQNFSLYKQTARSQVTCFFFCFLHG